MQFLEDKYRDLWASQKLFLILKSFLTFIKILRKYIFISIVYLTDGYIIVAILGKLNQRSSFLFLNLVTHINMLIDKALIYKMVNFINLIKINFINCTG